ncbi:hypothetical protein BH09MYX1_BH09MYX1_29080 [soil metagenome]
MKIKLGLAAFALLAATSVAGCSANVDAVDGDDQELTSLSARSRSLRFDGYVYVDANASDGTILSAVRAQTQTAFGALRTAEIGVNSRELKDVDPSTFKKTTVTVVDPTVANDPGKKMLKVTYRYTDMAVVPVAMARRTSLATAVMNGNYRYQTQRILKECTANDSEAQEFSSSIWYVFEPRLSSCTSAIAAEKKLIAADQAKIGSTQIPRSEVERLYIPITARLGADKTNKGKSYPEYDRLYAGGVEKDKVVIGLVSGLIDHGGTDETQDSGFDEYADELREAFRGHTFKLAKSEPAEDFTKITVGTKTYAYDGIQDWLAWKDGSGFPAGVSYADRAALVSAVSKKILRHWLTFEAPITVKIGSAAAKNVTLVIQAYFGSESGEEPHKRAIKTSDVYIYNGHSYIGYGPLDPSNFSSSDFPSSYQIMFIDGCVSYNYYEKDYLPLKSGGTKNLELTTNGLEAPSWHSGYAVGQFVSTLLNGKQASYLDLLTAAEATDSLRVVDGEVDNKFNPQTTAITVTNR